MGGRGDTQILAGWGEKSRQSEKKRKRERGRERKRKRKRGREGESGEMGKLEVSEERGKVKKN